jgi:hypothetical protein
MGWSPTRLSGEKEERGGFGIIEIQKERKRSYPHPMYPMLSKKLSQTAFLT